VESGVGLLKSVEIGQVVGGAVLALREGCLLQSPTLQKGEGTLHRALTDQGIGLASFT